MANEFCVPVAKCVFIDGPLKGQSIFCEPDELEHSFAYPDSVLQDRPHNVFYVRKKDHGFFRLDKEKTNA